MTNIIYHHGYAQTYTDSAGKRRHAAPTDVLGYMLEVGALYLADIRLHPASTSFPDWTASNGLNKLLRGRYYQQPYLGNPLRQSSGLTFEEAMRRYRRNVLGSHEGKLALDRLEGALSRSPIVVLCACADYSRCHRSVVCEALAARVGGAEIKRLVPAVEPKTDPLPLEALFDLNADGR